MKTQDVSAGSNAPSTRVTPVVVHGGLAFVSGQLPRREGALAASGKVGREIDLEAAREAARLCAHGCVAALIEAVGAADFVRVVKITGFVASAPEFHAQGAVIDAASDVLIERFGAGAGAHARSAVGVAELPHGAPVEIEMIAAVRQG